MRLLIGIFSAGAGAIALAAAPVTAFPEPYNSETRGNPMPAADAARSFQLPDGFRVTVFAAEPDVRQPISMAFDPRGRLWVGENYTYAEAQVNFATNLNDRILIFEDTDGDGRFDKRTVFWDQAKILTSALPGNGGVFVLCPPRLLFVPDRNGDDVPDGEPEVLLDGFNTTTGNRHTFANGLKWGPDGWLWGRVGISSQARIGRPGARDGERVVMNGGIWRYHPQRRVVEAVCHGTTNPWGLDWNEVGEPFFINTVIGHLWHAIPGAHFKRMHGEDVNPHSYDLIDQHADHYHFDTGKGWTASRVQSDGSAAPSSDELGGGHAHAGLMIYQGQNWPDAWRGRLFTLNLHGRRVNEERLERSGSGYVARHEPDFLRVGDTWFRGLDLLQGPDGGVFISDWSDTGECHDSDGVHRTSGRIYKVTYREPKKVVPPDFGSLSDADLIPFLFDANEWLVRHARRVLADRTAEGRNLQKARAELLARFDGQTGSVGKLRALWALNAAGGATSDWLLARTRDADEYVRSWAVRLLLDDPARGDEKVFARLIEMGRSDPSAFVRLYLASALQRLPFGARRELAAALVRHREDIGDHNLPLMLWYGIEPLVSAQPDAGIELALASEHQVIRRFIARRLAEDIESNPAPLASLLRRATESGAGRPVLFEDILRGLSDALRGLRKIAPPAEWAAFAAEAARSSDAATRDQVRDLSALFGDGRALEALRDVVADPKADAATRRSALKTLIEGRAENLAPLLKAISDDSTLRAPALAGLLQLGEPDASALAISRYQWLGLEERPVLLAALVSRPGPARALLDAVAGGKISRGDLSPFHARQIASLGDAALNQRLTEVWGNVRGTDAEKRATMERLRKQLSVDRLKAADLPHGRQLFNQVCASCHTLFGEGGRIGPDLTGSGRANLDYLLENAVDPSAVVPADYRMSVVELKDGRVLNGVVAEKTDRVLSLQTMTERVTVERGDIGTVRESALSLMPDGLIESLDETQVRDLIAYLMSPRQVPLPKVAAQTK
jgi:putative membrane-bound dehydrogenase-like protein